MTDPISDMLTRIRNAGHALRPVVESGGNFVLGGLFPNATTNQPMPEGLMPALLSRTNLIAYDWELTGPRIENLIYVGQVLNVR